MTSRLTRMVKPNRAQKILALSCLIWIGLVLLGLSRVWIYGNTPGVSGNAPSSWPGDSTIKRNNLPTLLLFIHPHCPCSRSTIGELAVLMARVQGKVAAHVLFVKPREFGEEWTRTDLFDSALAIPGVSVSIDASGTEANRFESSTSGQAILYDAQGKLIFQGGITAARGHFGDSAGVLSLQAILNGEEGLTETPVYGCPLRKDQPQNKPEEFCSGNH